MWKAALASLLICAAILAAGCSRQENQPYLRLSLQTEPTTLDPAYAVDYASGYISSLIHSNLVRIDASGRITGDLAKSWEVSEDALAYTFRLAPARFSNGRAVAASDIAFSFKRLLDPATVSPRWWVLKPLDGAEAFRRGGVWSEGAVEIPDDSTVVLRLGRATAHFLSLLSMPSAAVVCEEEVTRFGDDYGRNPCGSGPWRLAHWIEGDELFLERNEHYAGSRPCVDGAHFRIIPESMTRIAEFEVGNLDILEVPQAELRHWRSAGGRLLQAEELRIVYIGLNNARPPLDDPRVRRALNMAVDVEAIIAHVLFGAGKRARGLVPPALRGSPQPAERYPYDPAGARKLLLEAGFPDGFRMEIWQRENPEGGRILESVQGYLARVGVEVTLVTREWGGFKQAIDRGTPDAFYLDWFADYPDAENFIAPLFHSANRGGGGNRAGYMNVSVDSLIDAAERCGDDSLRWELYREAERRILDDAPWIFLWFPVRYEVVSPRLHGYRIPAIFNGQRFLEVTF